MTVGQRIRKARNNAGLTQAQLAQKLHVPYQSIGQWERGTRNPKYETLLKIASALNTTATELMGRHISSTEEIVNEIKSAADLAMEQGELDDKSAINQIISSLSTETASRHTAEFLFDFINSAYLDEAIEKLGFLKFDAPSLEENGKCCMMAAPDGEIYIVENIEYRLTVVDIVRLIKISMSELFLKADETISMDEAIARGYVRHESSVPPQGPPPKKEDTTPEE